MKRILRLVIVIGLICALTGCKTSEESYPMNVQITEKEFRISFFVESTAYDIEDLKKETPFDYHLQIEYLGDRENVVVYHGYPICVFTVCTRDGKEVVPAGRLDSLNSSTIKTKEKLEFNWNGSANLSEELSEGQYIVVASVEFALDSEFEEMVQCRLELPLTIQ